VLEEVAKSWKSRNGGVIVDGERSELKDILKNLEGSMVGGRIIASRELSRQNSLVLGSSQIGDVSHTRLGLRPISLGREDSQASLGMSSLEVQDEEEEDDLKDPRKWLKVIDAFEQPRLLYNVGKKHFDRYVQHNVIKKHIAHNIAEILQNLHCCHRPHIKHEYSETDITSFISVC
jgi:DNA polymerase epsilon subunit 2